MRFLIAVLVLLCISPLPAHAGPLETAKAKVHLDAVAAGNLEALMQDYADDAYMDWVGGPHDGRYYGKEAIRAVWQGFVDINAGKPRPAKFYKLESYNHPKGSSIEGKAEYGGIKPVNIWHVLIYRDGVLTSEIWQTISANQPAR